MAWSFRLFRVKGIDVKIHLTFLLILVWAAYRWGTLTGTTQGALFGIVVMLLLFLSVILHELGHSFQALRFGIPVKHITLWPFGGVAQIERVPEEPRQELQIAIAGPLVNVTIGFGLLLLYLALQGQGWLGVEPLYQAFGEVSGQGMLAYLIAANFVLALFNLLPAFPLDGGRVLRALLAMRIDYAKATRWAVTIGQSLAWGLGLWGFMSGSWTLILIAIFVYMAGGQEGRSTEIKHLLGEFEVGQAMSRQVQTLSPADPLSRAVDLTLQSMQSDFPVVEGDRVVGFLTERELLAGLQRFGLDQTVQNIMRTEFPETSAGTRLFDAQQQMATAQVHAIPVIEDGRVAGLLTAADINEALRLLSASPKLALGAA
jgi:Zn-dependent protease/CBS domain-containing protein